MSIDYTSYVSQISNLTVIPSSDPNFQTMLPGMIDYAEQRIYRELDLLETSITDSTNVSSGVRDLSLPTNVGTYIVIDNFNIITPLSGTTVTGTRNAAVPVTPDFIDMVYPSGVSVTGVPAFYARVNSSSVILGPSPDRAYLVEIRGTQRPTPLSSANSSTVLTLKLPDLFIAASMVFVSGYQRDFGSQTDNPAQAQSWENTYSTLFKSAETEEVRKSFQSQGWTSQQPSQIATPPRV